VAVFILAVQWTAHNQAKLLNNQECNMNKIEQAFLDGFIKAAIAPDSLEGLEAALLKQMARGNPNSGKVAKLQKLIANHPDNIGAASNHGLVGELIDAAQKTKNTPPVHIPQDTSALTPTPTQLPQVPPTPHEPISFHDPIFNKIDPWQWDPESEASGQGAEIQKALERLNPPVSGALPNPGLNGAAQYPPVPPGPGLFHKLKSNLRKGDNWMAEHPGKTIAGIGGTAGAGVGGAEYLKHLKNTPTPSAAHQILNNPKLKPQPSKIDGVLEKLMTNVREHPYRWGGGAALAAGLGGLGLYAHAHKPKYKDEEEVGGDPELV
jgi:hypothetical protein